MKKIFLILFLFVSFICKGQLMEDATNYDWKWTLTSTGTGAGVSTLSLNVNHDAGLTLTGTAYFTNVGGTSNLGQSIALSHTTMQTVYILVPSGTSVLKILNGEIYCTRVVQWTSSTNAASLAFNMSTLPKTLTYIYFSGNNTVTGNLWFTLNMTYFDIEGSNTIGGAFPTFTSGFTRFALTGNNTVSGTIPAFPAGLTYFYLTGNNTVNAFTNSFSCTALNYVYIVPKNPGGLSANDCANFIIALDGVTWAGSSRTLYLKGTNATPTPSAPLTAAKTDLTTTKSVTLSTN